MKATMLSGKQKDRISLWLVMLVAWQCVGLTAIAETEQKNTASVEPVSTQMPVVTVEPPVHYKRRKIFLAPLDLPAYAVHLVTVPLAKLAFYLEDSYIFQKTIDLLANDERTFFVFPVIRFEGGYGFGAGGGLLHRDLFHQNYKLRAEYSIFNEHDQLGEFTLRKGWRDGHLSGFRFDLNWKRNSDEDFFGVGNDTPKNNQAEFSHYQLAIRSGFAIAVKKTFEIDPGVGLILNKTDPENDGIRPAVETQFPLSSLSGFNRQINYFNAYLALRHDTRNQEGSPNRGGLREFRFQRFQGLNTSGFNFNQYDIDVSQFFGFRALSTRHVIVLHNGWQFQQETGSNQIPFYHLTALDQNTPLRGFNTGRFREKI